MSLKAVMAAVVRSEESLSRSILEVVSLMSVRAF